jgi:hypothetical protein
MMASFAFPDCARRTFWRQLMKFFLSIFLLAAGPMAAFAQTPFVNPYKDGTLGVTRYTSF